MSIYSQSIRMGKLSILAFLAICTGVFGQFILSGAAAAGEMKVRLPQAAPIYLTVEFVVKGWGPNHYVSVELVGGAFVSGQTSMLIGLPISVQINPSGATSTMINLKATHNGILSSTAPQIDVKITFDTPAGNFFKGEYNCLGDFCFQDYFGKFTYDPNTNIVTP